MSPLLHLGLLLLTGAAGSSNIQGIAVSDVFRASGPGGGGKGAPVSFWCCSMITTSSNSTLLFAQASVKAAPAGESEITAGYVGTTVMGRSSNSGVSWSNMTAVSTLSDPARKITYPSQAVFSSKAGAVILLTTPGVFASKHNGPIGPNGTASVYMTKSTDDGLTWTPRELIAGAWGGGETHGIELKRGAHKGRLVMPRINDPWAGRPGHVDRAFAMLSDDGGATWQKGQPLPTGWGEAAVAELRNGSILWTSRLGPPYCCCRGGAKCHYDPPVLRGMARSDDGGFTFNETWLIAQDNPAQILFGTCESSIAADKEGRIFWGHPGSWPPGNLTRANYSVHASTDGKAWALLDTVYPGGAGYSDLAVMPDGRLGMAFQRTLFEAGVEGGGYNTAFARVSRGE